MTSPKLSDYPFVPHHAGHSERLTGLHKLKAFRDDDPMKRILFELYCNTHGVKPEPEPERVARHSPDDVGED